MAANNPRKFEEKIAQHKLRQAQETKEFEKIMEEMQFVNAIKSHAQNQRQTRGRYGGSLPDFNIAQSQSRHENLNDLPLRHTMDVQSPLKDRPYHRNRVVNSRRHNMDTASPYHFGPYLSPPQMDANWRRTSSDSSLYHTLTNPDGARKMSTSPDSSREVGSFLAPKENEVLDIKLGPTSAPQQQQQQQPVYNYSNNGSLPDLTNLHIPSPLSASIDNEEQYTKNYSNSANSNVFLRQPQPRRNTTGASCKRQVYHRHPPGGLDPLQVPTSSYMFQQSVGGASDPTSPTGAPMYPAAPMSPLANGPGYLQYQGSVGSANIHQQLEQMATIAESLKPLNISNGQLGQSLPPQSPNTFLTNMLSQNPAAMEMVRERFQDAVLSSMEAGNHQDSPLGNSLAQDIGDAIGGYEFGGAGAQAAAVAAAGYRYDPAEIPAGISLAPLDVQDLQVLAGQSEVVANPEDEELFRREGQQQLMRQ